MIKELVKKIIYSSGFLVYQNAGYSLHHRKSGLILKSEDKYRLDLYKKMFHQEELLRKPFYNIGSGSFYHPHWTNIDYVSEWYKKTQKNVLHYDLMALEPLPVSDGSAKVMYTSHTIEHVKDIAVSNLFKEVYRALEAGGIFRITTGPDAETDYNALKRQDKDWFYWDYPTDKKGRFAVPLSTTGLADRWLHHVATPLSRLSSTPSKIKYNEKEIMSIIQEKSFEEALDYFTDQCEFNPAYIGDHISWWTHAKIFLFLKKAGFKTMYTSGYRQSISPLLRQSELFDSTHPQMSIYVEAIKD